MILGLGLLVGKNGGHNANRPFSICAMSHVSPELRITFASPWASPRLASVASETLAQGKDRRGNEAVRDGYPSTASLCGFDFNFDKPKKPPTSTLIPKNTN